MFKALPNLEKNIPTEHYLSSNEVSLKLSTNVSNSSPVTAKNNINSLHRMFSKQPIFTNILPGVNGLFFKQNE